MLDKLAAAGGAPEAEPDELLYLWPESVKWWGHWSAVRTQWRVGMGGVVGLDYTGVRACLDERGVRRRERRDLFAAIQACELAVLEAHEERRAQERERERQKKG